MNRQPEVVNVFLFGCAGVRVQSMNGAFDPWNLLPVVVLCTTPLSLFLTLWSIKKSIRMANCTVQRSLERLWGEMNLL